MLRVPQIAGSYRGSYFSKVRSSVANFVARSGKGAVQGAVQACCEAAAYSAVAKWLWLLFTAVGNLWFQIWKHWFERWLVVLRLGRIGSNVWEPAVPMLPQPIRTAKKRVSETCSIWGLCRCNLHLILHLRFITAS